MPTHDLLSTAVAGSSPGNAARDALRHHSRRDLGGRLIDPIELVDPIRELDRARSVERSACDTLGDEPHELLDRVGMLGELLDAPPAPRVQLGPSTGDRATARRERRQHRLGWQLAASDQRRFAPCMEDQHVHELVEQLLKTKPPRIVGSRRFDPSHQLADGAILLVAGRTGHAQLVESTVLAVLLGAIREMTIDLAADGTRPSESGAPREQRGAPHDRAEHAGDVTCNDDHERYH